MPNTMNQDYDLCLLKSLVLKKSLSLKNLKETERWLLLSCAALTLKFDEIYSEVEVSFALKKWLSEEGEMLRIDAIELRRTLIDLALWKRSVTGREYYLAVLNENHDAYPQWVALQASAYSELICRWKAEELVHRQERLKNFKQLS